MSDTGRQIVRAERRQVYDVACADLPGQDPSRWREALDAVGLPPKRVRKALAEASGRTRGVMRIELREPAPRAVVAEAIDAAGATRPEEGHVYEVGEPTLVSPGTGAGYGTEPLELDAGDRFVVAGEVAGDAWMVDVLSGSHEGRTGVLKLAEWERRVDDLEDLGPRDGAVGDDAGGAEGEDESDDWEPGDAADHETEPGNPYLVRTDPPEWPDKPGVKSHFTFDVDDWVDAKRQEIADRQDNQDGGRGGF